MKRFLVIFSGQVQGVGFRWVLSKFAAMYGLTGWVENRYDGLVECQLQGKKEDVLTVVMRMHNASQYIIIDDYSIKEIPVDPDESSFSVRY